MYEKFYGYKWSSSKFLFIEKNLFLSKTSNLKSSISQVVRTRQCWPILFFRVVKAGNTNRGGKLGTVDLLIMLACFVKKQR